MHTGSEREEACPGPERGHWARNSRVLSTRSVVQKGLDFRRGCPLGLHTLVFFGYKTRAGLSKVESLGCLDLRAILINLSLRLDF